jgi:hypothetical protein
MYLPPDYQAHQDNEQLKMLTIFYYVMGGLTSFMGCFGLFYVCFGAFMASNPGNWTSNGHPTAPPPPGFSAAIIIFGSIFVLFGFLVGGLTAYAGKCIKERRSFTFIQVIAGIMCLNMPLGTALGVFTFIVFSRPSVKALFGQYGPPMQQWEGPPPPRQG